MADFRNGNTRVLIATDLLARGIDVQQVSIVVNYDLPRDYANYIHRFVDVVQFLLYPILYDVTIYSFPIITIFQWLFYSFSPFFSDIIIIFVTCRIGRGGRLGRQAVAINLCGGARDLRTLAEIADHYSITIPELPNNIKDLI